MMGRSLPWLLAGAATALAPAAHATSPVEILIGDAGQRDADGAVLVEVRLLNGGTEPQTVPLPDRIEAQLTANGVRRTLWLERTADMPADLIIPPDGFRRARYRLPDTDELSLDGAVFSIPAWSAQQIAIALRPAPVTQSALPELAPAQAAASAAPEAARPPSDRSAGNPFLANLSAYEPIYAVYGPGTNSEARIQISFKYQLFGTRRAEGLPRSWRDGLHFAFSQRMFWDLGGDSSPFRNIDYQPELFYLTPSATLSSGISLSAQGGIRHESNGRDGTASRSINSVYIAPMAAIPLGGGYRFSVAPRLSLFVGDKSDNPDIRRYRGNTALFMEVGEDKGLRLSTSTRFNFGSGKGAFSADISYPLPRLLGGGPDFYLFGQSFVGYGENLLDYDRRMTRFRIGVALVR
ncbi:phospholipase A [Sphingobium sp. WTD-1]|uniref:phospholipase A n=1 Tax=Sphingobium sp. WTD-1 TaxID=2979467 RepID=UPI0024DE61AF|nr:phospholipase A [Sphingobium sp. WTD-1]WIA54841.1 phospholipase A [Sphingobium sp. WTD-1]